MPNIIDIAPSIGGAVNTGFGAAIGYLNTNIPVFDSAANLQRYRPAVGAPTVGSAGTLNEAPSFPRNSLAFVCVTSTGGLFRWDETVTADNATNLKPNFLGASVAGRWVRVMAAGTLGS